MRKILERWEITNVLKELSALKQIFVEPQNNSQLLMRMEEYREVIRESSSISFRKPSGAIFFAVFRGKVAEGIDFKDNEARCVLAVNNALSFIFFYLYIYAIYAAHFRLSDRHTICL